MVIARPSRLLDNFGRQHTYLRISITDRCNLRCRYCMPPGGIELGPKSSLLSFDEILTLAKLFVDLGVKKIRMTGGEPLVRKGVEDLCSQLAGIPGLETLALSTNGVLLTDKARVLKAAGVNHVNISLDTLKPERFERIALRSLFDETIRGIDAALDARFASLKINTVVMRGFNDDELPDFVAFAKARSLHVRFIEYMPFLGNSWNEVRMMPYKEMRGILETRFQLVPAEPAEGIPGPAKEFHIAGSDAVVGFITTMTEHFCDSCNRIRLTADGKLRNCLFGREEIDLRRLLRSGASHEVIEDSIRMTVILKREQHPDTNTLLEEQNRSMVAIGG